MFLRNYVPEEDGTKRLYSYWWTTIRSFVSKEGGSLIVNLGECGLLSVMFREDGIMFEMPSRGDSTWVCLARSGYCYTVFEPGYVVAVAGNLSGICHLNRPETVVRNLRQGITLSTTSLCVPFQEVWSVSTVWRQMG